MNNKIIHEFERLLKFIKTQSIKSLTENNPKEANIFNFKISAIKNVIKIISSLDFEITDAKELKGYPGIGKSSLQRIDEIITNGYLEELGKNITKKDQEIINNIQELEGVIGIGPVNAKKLVSKYGIKNIAELKKAISNGKYKASNSIKLGLKYYGSVQGQIPRKEITETEKYLKKIAKRINRNLEVMVCGSYRRGKATSGDIDLLMYNPDIVTNKQLISVGRTYLEDFVNYLEEEKFILDKLNDKNYTAKFMGFSKYRNYPIRRLDIRYIPYESLPTATLYFTGPAELNKEMRREADKRNMFLNEYGLYKKTNDTLKKISIQSEKDVFDKLGMTYLTPVEREIMSTGKIKKVI
jgi:DNA polymerase/3'-5' exonuclease PolX